MASPWLSMLLEFDRAPLRVQVEVQSVERSSEFRAHVCGEIVRVFRGDSAHMGQPVTLSLACLGPSGEVPLGDACSDLASLQRTRVMEVFLETLSSELIEPLHSHFDALQQPTDQPSFDLPAALVAAKAVEEQGEAERRAESRKARAYAAANCSPLGLLGLWWLLRGASGGAALTLAEVAWWAWMVVAPVRVVWTVLKGPAGLRFSPTIWILVLCWIASLIASVVGLSA